MVAAILPVSADAGAATSDAYHTAERADRRHGDRFETLGCSHLDAVAALVWNGWLPESRTGPGADTGATETTDQELPGCFKTGFGTGANCPF